MNYNGYSVGISRILIKRSLMIKKATSLFIFLLSSVIILPTGCNTSEALAIPIKSENVFVPQELGSIELLYSATNFLVRSDSGFSVVQRCYMDEELRGISKIDLAKLLLSGSYILVKKLYGQNGREEYGLTLEHRLNGGGVFGAAFGAIVGKAAVSVVGHGAIYLLAAGVSVVCPPAGVATSMALESVFGPAIESASIAAAAAFGTTCAVATGPI